MQTTLDQVHDDLYNHGKDGIKTVLQTFIAEYRQGEKDRKDFQNLRDQEIKDALAFHYAKSNRKMSLGMLVIAVLALAVAILGLRQTGFKVSFNQSPHSVSSNQEVPQVSTVPQE
jgi:hypothetical protein